MKHHISNDFVYRILCCFGVVALWSAGIVISICIFHNTDVDYMPICRSLVVSSPSLILMLLVRLPILLITAALLVYFKWGYAFWIVFISVTYGLVISAIYRSFGSAGWLMVLLMLAPDSLLLALLLHLSILSFLDPFFSVRKNILLSTAAICAVSIIEYYCVYPFTSALF